MVCQPGISAPGGRDVHRSVTSRTRVTLSHSLVDGDIACWTLGKEFRNSQNDFPETNADQLHEGSRLKSTGSLVGEGLHWVRPWSPQSQSRVSFGGLGVLEVLEILGDFLEVSWGFLGGFLGALGTPEKRTDFRNLSRLRKCPMMIMIYYGTRTRSGLRVRDFPSSVQYPLPAQCPQRQRHPGFRPTY
jgi:hypothetical protein